MAVNAIFKLLMQFENLFFNIYCELCYVLLFQLAFLKLTPS